MTPTDTAELWSLVEGEGPLFATALHDGHDLRPEVAQRMALPEEVRLREEDPFTGAWAVVAGTRMLPRWSRFEVDLNRPRDRAVYLRPEDAWGLRVWEEPPPDDLVARSLSQYDAFYAEAERVLRSMAAREGRFVVFDLHSYNHRRAGPGARFDAQSKHPDVNLGTASMHRARWAPVVDRFVAELSACEDLGRRLDVRENIKFMGGNFSRWVHETFPEQGCSLAIELKKFFMDEWSGQLYTDQHRGILDALRRAADGVREELGRLELPPLQPARPTDPAAVDYGDLVHGLWRCQSCGYEVLPRELAGMAALPPFECPDCDERLSYGRCATTSGRAGAPGDSSAG